MKLLGILVIYATGKWDCGTIIGNMRKYLNSVDKLIVWDNTPSTSNLRSLDIWFQELLTKDEFEKLEFKGSGYNVGLSYAYNRAIEYAIQFGYTHLLTMDQDSQWEDFEKFRNYVAAFFKELQPNAIIGPVINEDEQNETVKVVPNLINSGAIIPINVFKKIGGYCERFLVDAVDVEICSRAHKYGIPVYKVKGYGRLLQEFGNMTYFGSSANVRGGLAENRAYPVHEKL